MNYITEIKMFNEWLETNELSPAGISLWYGLMFIANRSGWRPELSIPISAIMLRTKISRSAIYRERNSLRDFGLIDFEVNEGRQSSIYKILSFEDRVASQLMSSQETQSGTNMKEESTVPYPHEIQVGTSPESLSHDASTAGTQSGIEIQSAYPTGTQDGSIYKPKQSISTDKEKKKSSYKGKDKIDLSFIADPLWKGLVKTWLDYKESRKEGYVSEMSARKFLTMLKNLADNDPLIAQKIIDKSIAQNWKGIFAFTDEARTSTQPAKGQRIGQIIQPATDEKRSKLLRKFEPK